MKWLAILNPAAHNGVGLNPLRSIARVLRKELGATCVWTSYPRHARDIARGSNDFNGLIAVGGDGTIYEVVNGMDLKTQCIAIVPAGTGNGLAHELHIGDAFSVVQHLKRPRLAALDLILVRFRAGGVWQTRYVVHTSSLGYVAELVALAMEPLKRLSSFRYAASACVQCWRQKHFCARMSIDERDEQQLQLTNLVVNNSRYAGPFCVFPKARLQDGRLDVLYGNNSPAIQFCEDLGILTQTYYLERSHRLQVRQVRVDLESPTTLMLDGELITAVDAVRFQIASGCLRCVAGGTSGLRLLDERSSPLASSEGALNEPVFAPC